MNLIVVSMSKQSQNKVKTKSKQSQNKVKTKSKQSQNKNLNHHVPISSPSPCGRTSFTKSLRSDFGSLQRKHLVLF